MNLASIGTYEPAWEDRGRRVAGPDEDVTTMAVAAGLAALKVAPCAEIRRVAVVTQRPDVLEGATPAVITLGLGLAEDIPVELRVGAAPDAVDALTSAGAGTLVIGVDAQTDGSAGAAAAVLGDDGAVLSDGGRVEGALPMRVQHVGSPSLRAYDDARLERDRGWRPVLDRLGGDGSVIVGVAPRQAERLGSADTVSQVGAAAPLFALAALIEAKRDGRVVALDAARGAALEVADAARISLCRSALPALPLSAAPQPPQHAAEIPLSLPAYDRAFRAKVGLIGARCSCGEVSFPPRSVCLSCGAEDDTEPLPLPYTGEVYTAVTVHAPVPGMPGPYGLAIVQLDELPLRVLAHVTDSAGSQVSIGARGRLVLRRVAIREGVPDYGYGFQPEPVSAEAAA